MLSIHGQFAIHRIKTIDGRDALMLVADGPQSGPWMHGSDDSVDDLVPISFELVQGGEHMPDSYVTITMSSGNKIHFGPYVAKVVKQ